MDFLAHCSIVDAIAEMHVLAYCYHWDEESLWNMPQVRRKVWFKMVREQKNAESPDYQPSSSGKNPLSAYKESI